MNTTVYIIGIFLQAIAGILALIEVRYAPRKLPWFLISISSLLIVVRRLSTLEQFTKAGRELAVGEVLTLVISLLFFLGVVLMSRMFREMQNAHRNLQQLEEQYRRVVTKSPHPIILLDNEKVEFANKAVADLFGYEDMHELIGLSIIELLTGNDSQIIQKALFGSTDDADYVPFDLKIKSRDGKTKYAQISTVAINILGKNLSLFIATDITELKRLENILRSSGAYNRRLIEASPDPLVTIGGDGKINDVNTATEQATGFSRRELVGCDFAEFFTNPQKASEGYQKVFSDGFVRDYPLEIRNKNGTTIPVLYNATLYRDENGQVAGVFAAARDITLLKKAEAELRELYERVAADAMTKERLLREVNHRVKNNLMGIIGLLLTERRVAQRRGELSICETIDNISVKIRSMLDAHQLLSDTGWAPVPLTTLSERILEVVIAALPFQVKVNREVASSTIVVSPRQAGTIALILNELATNSMKHAVGNRSEVSIFVSMEKIKGSIQLIYRDDGPGYPQDIINGNRSNVGIDLVRQLTTRTLRGKVTFNNDNGAVTTLLIKTEESERT